jgi:hypothetical protein
VDGVEIKNIDAIILKKLTKALVNNHLNSKRSHFLYPIIKTLLYLTIVRYIAIRLIKTLHPIKHPLLIIKPSTNGVVLNAIKVILSM